MKFVRAIGLVVLIASQSIAHPAIASTPRIGGEQTQSAAPSSNPDFTSERESLAAARAALEQSDYAAARMKAAEAVRALLAYPDAQRDDAWARLLDDVGFAAWRAQDIGTANAAFEQVERALSATLSDEDPRLLSARGRRAVTLKVLGDSRTARAIEEHVLEVRLRIHANDHSDVQLARQNLAVTLKNLGELSEARALEVQVLEVRSRTHPPDHADLQAAKANLAGTLFMLGEFEAARVLFEDTLEVYSRTRSGDDPDLQGTRINLAGALRKLGELERARGLLEQALESYSRTLPADHPNLQAARVNLAVTLRTLGDLHAARELYQTAVDVFSRTRPADDPGLQEARQGLATSILDLGDRDGARALFESVLEVRSRTLPAEHPDLQRARQGLETALYALGDLEAARALEEQVLESRLRALPEQHVDVQMARSNLANTLLDLGESERAHELLEAVHEALSHGGNEDDPYLQLARLNLARAREALGDLDGARTLEELALEVFARTLPAEHAHFQLARTSLAWTLLEQRERDGGEDPARAAIDDREERCAQRVLELCQGQLGAARKLLLASSAREASSRCAELASALDDSISIANRTMANPAARIDRASFELSETTRAAALGAARLIRRGSSGPQYDRLRQELRARSEELADSVLRGTNTEQFHRLLERREGVERELAALARELSGGAVAGLDFETDALANVLSDRDAIVAYRAYGRADPAGTRDRVASLCAFVVRPVDATASARTVRVQRVELGPIEPIASVVRAWRERIGTAQDARGVAASAARAEQQSSEAGAALRRLVFDPLMSRLAGVDHVIVVLDDVLHLVPLAALPAAGEESEYVGDRMRIETRVSVGELLVSSATVTDGGLLVVGGVAYDGPGEHETPRHMAAVLRGGAFADGFADLPATGLEARAIAETFTSGSDSNAALNLLEHDAATRERFFELAPRARWIHVATHGWFSVDSVPAFEDVGSLDRHSNRALRRTGSDQVKRLSPMLLCGLAFSGANRSKEVTGRATGLATADEISALDLSGCELAVLSACDTNVGERSAGQGVASFQQALQMAGARSVITSLWKVSDEATRELMSDFYRRLWVEKKPKWRALRDAQTMLRSAKDDVGRPKFSTRDWAAWVLTGSPD